MGEEKGGGGGSGGERVEQLAERGRDAAAPFPLHLSSFLALEK